jgi:hypothetical protein
MERKGGSRLVRSVDCAARVIQASWRGAVTRHIVSLFLSAVPRHGKSCPMHYGRTATISASGGAGYRDRVSMLCSAQKVRSVPLQPHHPELGARPFGSSSVHQGHGLSQNPNGMEMQGVVQQVQTILCCLIQSGIVVTRGPTSYCSTIASAVEGYIAAEII